MLIDKIKNIGQNLTTQKTSPSKSIGMEVGKDNIEISDAARQKAVEVKMQADVQTITKQTLSLPADPERQAKIQAIKEKLQRGDYDNLSHETLSATADRLLVDFFGA